MASSKSTPVDDITSSSPRSQSFFDAASGLIASFREGRSPTSESRNGSHRTEAGITAANVNAGDRSEDEQGVDVGGIQLSIQEDIGTSHSEGRAYSVELKEHAQKLDDGSDATGAGAGLTNDFFVDDEEDDDDDDDDDRDDPNSANAMHRNVAGYSSLARIMNRGISEGDGHFAISIDSPNQPRPAITKTASKTAVAPSLPAIDEQIVATLDIGHHGRLQQARQRVGRALQDVLAVLPVTKMSPECYQAVEDLNTWGQPISKR